VVEVVGIVDEATSHVTNVVAEDTWLEHVHHQLEALAVDEVLMSNEWQEIHADIVTNLYIGRKIAQLI
jgi:NADH:ubiquinone oxidoreductase subunit